MPKPTLKPHAARTDLVLARSHFRFGWWVMVVFFTMGLGLEGAHALKMGFYLNVGNETRRLMWTLGHAHGTLLGLVNIALGVTMIHFPEWKAPRRQLASRALFIATALLPGGFLLGGLFVHSGDPGLGILLIPPGGVLLVLCAVLAALGISSRG